MHHLPAYKLATLSKAEESAERGSCCHGVDKLRVSSFASDADIIHRGFYSYFKYKKHPMAESPGWASYEAGAKLHVAKDAAACGAKLPAKVDGHRSQGCCDSVRTDSELAATGPKNTYESALAKQAALSGLDQPNTNVADAIEVDSFSLDAETVLSNLVSATQITRSQGVPA